MKSAIVRLRRLFIDRVLAPLESAELLFLLVGLAAAGLVLLTSRLAGGEAALAMATGLVVYLVLQNARRRHKIEMRRLVDVHHHERVAGLYAYLKPRYPLPAFGGYSILPDFAQVLIDEITRRRPPLILDCGSGASTLIAAYLAERYGGRVVALDHDPYYAEQTRRMLADHGLTDVADVRLAPLRPVTVNGHEFVWYDPAAVEDLSQIPFVVVDGPPKEVHRRARYPAMGLLHSRLAPSFVMLLDDADRPGEQDMAAQWQRQYGVSLTRIRHIEKGALLVARDEPEQPAEIT